MSAPTMTRPAVFDEQATRTWLSTLHSASTGHVWVGSTADRFKGRAFDTADRAWLDQAVEHVGRFDRAGAAGTYVRTTTLQQAPERGRGGDNDSYALPGLAADLDIAGPGHKTDKPLPPNPRAAKNIIDESGLPDPSVWVHSGGGLYAWWLLDKPHIIGGDLDRIKRLAARWQDPIEHAAVKLGYSHGRLGDLARILRIPGTVNRKPAMPEPRMCRILEDTGRRYNLDNLRGALTDALAAMPTPKPLQPQFTTIRIGSMPRGGNVRSWHDFEARIDWAEILEPHGWIFSHRQGCERFWIRPGKGRHETHGASTGKDPARDRLYVFTTDAPPFEANTLYLKFDAYKILNHDGDWKAAARELERLGYGTPWTRVSA